MIMKTTLVPRLVSLTLALLLCGTGPGFAQEPDGYGAFLDSIEVRVVNIDVVVTDRSGTFVPGLKKEDFQLFADGKPVEITHFAAYLPGAPEANSPAETAVLVDEEVPLDVVAPPPASYAILLDQTLVRPGERNSLLEQLRKFLATGLRDGDRVMLAAYDNGLRLYTDLTTDRPTVDAALAELEKRATAVSAMANREAAMMRDIARVNTADRTAVIDAENLFDQIQVLEDEALKESLSGMDALAYLSESLAGVEGRKAVLYAGGGFTATPTERLYNMWQQKFALLVLTRNAALRSPHVPEVERRQSRLIEKAGAHRVTLYSILAGPDHASAVSGVEFDTDAGPFQNTSTDPARESALAYMASATGGLTVSAGPQLAVSLHKVVADFAQYYSLAFTPSGRGSQRIEVRARPGLNVRYRNYFRAEDAGNRTSQTAVAALLFKEAPNPLEAAATSGAAKPEGKGDTLLVPVTVRVPLRHVTLLPEGDHHQARLTFDFAARDSSGRIQVMERRELPLSVPNDKMQAALRQHISFDVQLKLAPGAYRVAVLVEDQLGATRSALTLDTEVARP